MPELSIRLSWLVQGIVYTDLQGLEVFPAVCFYSSGRTISLLKVEIPTSSVSAYLCDLSESTALSRIHGVLGKKRLVAGPGSDAISLNGRVTDHGLCTPVPADGSTAVVYELDVEAVCLCGNGVALCV